MTFEHCLALAIIVFSIGTYGAMTRRNLIAVFLSVELMLNAANISFVTFAHFRSMDAVAGCSFVIFIMAVAACEMAIGLGIVVAMYRRRRSLDVNDLEELYG